MRMKKEKGAMVVILAVVFIILISLAGFLVDVGILYVNRAKIYSISDASALAGTKELGPKQSANDTESQQAIRAYQYAEQYLNENKITENDKYQITLGRWDITTNTFNAGVTPYNAVSVQITRKVKLYFSQIFGIRESNVVSLSIARIGRAKRGTYSYAILPIGVQEGVYATGTYVEIHGYNLQNIAPGFKGTLNFDRRWSQSANWNDVNKNGYIDVGEATSNNDYNLDGKIDENDEHKGGKYNDTSTWIVDNGTGTQAAQGYAPISPWEYYIMNGYPGNPPYWTDKKNPPLNVNQRVDVITGIASGPFKNALNTYIANFGTSTFICPLVDDPVKQGTNASVRISRFAVFQITDGTGQEVTVVNNTSSVDARFVQILVDGEIDDTPDQSESDPDIFAMKLVK
jgi:Flp pilus assembly protein TadG